MEDLVDQLDQVNMQDLIDQEEQVVHDDQEIPVPGSVLFFFIIASSHTWEV